MKTSIIPLSLDSIAADRSHWLDRQGRRQVHRQLSLIEQGEIVVREGDNETYLSLIHISEPTRPPVASRMPSSA